MSIRTKVIVILSALLVVAFASISVVTYFVSANRYEETIRNEVLPMLSGSALTAIQQELMRRVEVAVVMARNAFVRDWAAAGEQDLEPIVKYLREIKESFGFSTAFFISDRTGKYYNHAGLLKTLSQEDPHDVWYYAFKEKDVDLDLDVDTDEAASGTWTVFVNHRVLDDEGGFLGVTGAGSTLADSVQLLVDFSSEPGRLVYVIDSNGTVQGHPVAGLIGTTIHEMEGVRDVAADILAEGGVSDELEFHRGSTRVYLVAKPLGNTDWIVLAEQEVGPFLGQIRSTMIVTLVIGLLATGIVLAIVISVVNRFQGRLEAQARQDPLTGVANRRFFIELLQAEVRRSERYNRAMSLLQIDADEFKSVNDHFGHESGDLVLKALAASIQDALRASDTLGRLGGEEFAVLLPETGLEEAVAVAERIREFVESRPIEVPGQQVLHVTVSVGAASKPPGCEDCDSLLKQADEAMYRAKKTGRNRVCT